MLVVAPVQAADEAKSSAPRGRFTLDFALGTQLQDGGDLQAVSFGYTPWRSVTLLVNVERNHVPTRIRTYADGYSATRGGTLTSVNGELRYTVPVGGRVAPYALAGRGAGRSRPNVNDIFPDRVTNPADVFYAGGGVRVQLRPRVAMFVDAKFSILVEGEGLGAMMPIRAGVTWRF